MNNKIYIPYLCFMAIILSLPVFVTSPYYLGVMVLVGIFSLITVGLSLLMGYAGQISLGHAAFFGVGAYASAILTGTYRWSPWVAMLAGIVLAGSIAWIVGTPSLKLKGHYLAMATLGFGLIVNIFFVAEFRLTGGPSGYTYARIPNIYFLKWIIKSEISSYFFVWGIFLFILLLTLHIIHSRVGRALRAIHGDEEAARAMGVNAAHYKVGIFVLSAIYASIAGSLYCHYIRFVAPDPFGLTESVLLVTMVIIGGMGSVWGAIFGASLLMILPEVLRAFRDYNILIYGGILLFIMLFLPGGIFGGSQMAWRLLKRTFDRRRET